MGRLGRCFHAKYFAFRRGTTLHELPSVFIIITAGITDPTMASNAGVTLEPVSLPRCVTVPLLCGSRRGRFDLNWVDARQEAQRLTVSHAEELPGTGPKCAAGGLHMDVPILA